VGGKGREIGFLIVLRQTRGFLVRIDDDVVRKGELKKLRKGLGGKRGEKKQTKGKRKNKKKEKIPLPLPKQLNREGKMQ